MTRLILLLLVMTTLAGRAALTLVAREPFVGPGVLTSASPGSNFSSVSGGTFTLVRVGPRTSAIAAPGWSADFRTSGPSNVRGTINLTGQASLCGMWGAWVRVKALPTTGNYLSVLQLVDMTNNVVMDFKLNPNGVISTSPFDGGATPPVFTSPAIPLNTWVWLAVAWQNQGGITYGLRCLSMPLGGTTPTVWGSADAMNSEATSFSSVNVGMQVGGTGPMVRIGCPSLYSMSSFADIAYPSDVIPPVQQSYNWYVNTVSGNDANDGSTPQTAWKSAAKITTESQYCGMLDSTAAGPGGGDVLTIDTSGGALVLGANTLTFATQGLKVQPASGQTYIKSQAEEFLANTGFTATSGLSKTYQTTDTQADIVPWQNDEWLWHVQAASFNATATVTNPKTGAATIYSSAGAALDAVSGSFFTDGIKLYLHPFNDTNPATDGNTYTRSINRANGAAAVAFTAGNFLANGFYIRKTALVDQYNNDFGAYCLQDEVASGSGFSSEVENSYFAYGDKHCFGSTTGVTNSSLLVLNTECEQGQPYCIYGGQSPFVSYSGATTGDVVHTYMGCTCLARSGLIGSTAGDPVGSGGDIILSHNNGGGTISFGTITIDDCNFGSGTIDINGAQNLAITDHTQTAEIFTASNSTIVNETTFTSEIVQMGAGSGSLVLKNCLIKPVFALSATRPTYYGLLVSGNCTVEGCTFDLSSLTGDSATYFTDGVIERTGGLQLVFRNNVYLVSAGENFPVLSGAMPTDKLTFDHNAYNLGGGTTFARNYGATGSMTFSQWQALGQDDINSTLGAYLNLQQYIPQSGSPLINGGVDLGTGTDFTGTLYPHRNTIGAYEGAGSYLAPQAIANFPTVSATFTGSTETMPGTTESGLPVTYSVISGPASFQGNVLTVTGTGQIMVQAVQAGNSTYAPLTEMQILSALPPPGFDTPTLPGWALALLGGALAWIATRRLRTAGMSPRG